MNPYNLQGPQIRLLTLSESSRLKTTVWLDNNMNGAKQLQCRTLQDGWGALSEVHYEVIEVSRIEVSNYTHSQASGFKDHL
jgi:hypothetical protein